MSLVHWPFRGAGLSLSLLQVVQLSSRSSSTTAHGSSLQPVTAAMFLSSLYLLVFLFIYYFLALVWPEGAAPVAPEPEQQQQQQQRNRDPLCDLPTSASSISAAFRWNFSVENCKKKKNNIHEK